MTTQTSSLKRFLSLALALCLVLVLLPAPSVDAADAAITINTFQVTNGVPSVKVDVDSNISAGATLFFMILPDTQYQATNGDLSANYGGYDNFADASECGSLSYTGASATGVTLPLEGTDKGLDSSMAMVAEGTYWLLLWSDNNSGDEDTWTEFTFTTDASNNYTYTPPKAPFTPAVKVTINGTAAASSAASVVAAGLSFTYAGGTWTADSTVTADTTISVTVNGVTKTATATSGTAVELKFSEVTFDPDGGTPAPGKATGLEGETVTLPTGLTKSGFSFQGWSTSGSLPAVSNYKYPAAGATLKAIWGAKTAANAGSYTIDNPTYNGQAKTPTLTPGTGCGAVSNIRISGNGLTNASSATNAGTYTVTFNTAENGTYAAGTDLTKSWTINKANTTASLSKTSATYGATGYDTLPTVTVKSGTTTLAQGTDYSVSWNPGAVTNVGSYTATITMSNNNYNGPSGSLSYTVSAAKFATPTGTGHQASSDAATDGYITITNPVAGATYQISSDNGTTWQDKTLNASNQITGLGKGSYQVRVKADTNHTASDAATIAVSAAGAPVAELSNKTVEYDGNPQSVSATVKVDGTEVTGYTVYYTGTDGTTYAKSATAPSAVGKYTVSVEKAGGPNPAETATLTITKKKVTVTAPTFAVGAAIPTTAPVTGQVGSEDVSVTLAWNPADTTAEAKNYTWTATLAGADAANYELTADTGKVNLAPAPSGGGGGGAVTVKVTFDVGENGTLNGKDTINVTEGGKLIARQVPSVTAHSGWKFLGWSADGKTAVDPTTVKIDKETTFTALYEREAGDTGFRDDYTKPYMFGYPSGRFEYRKGITRAEVATIVARTILPEFDENFNEMPSYSDLQGGHWANKYIAYLEDLGVLTGYPDGTFKPNQVITRAEYVAIIGRVEGLTEGSNPYKDVEDLYWATPYIESASAQGYVNGYSDGTFRPRQYITREEGAKIMNAVLGWTNATPAGAMRFPDVYRVRWSYDEILKASTGIMVEGE